MHLFSRKVFPFVLILAIACHDSTAPLRLPAQFALTDISHRPLPTTYANLTILSAILTLEQNTGRAVLVEQLRSGGIDGTFTNVLSYSIDGNRIKINGMLQPCPVDAQCVNTTYTGTISEQALNLVSPEITIDGPVVYNYRITSTLD